MTVSEETVDAACWSIDPVDGPTDAMRQAVRAALQAASPFIKAEALRNAAAAIQAMHPGEVKNSVVFLENLATEIEKGKS